MPRVEFLVLILLFAQAIWTNADPWPDKPLQIVYPDASHQELLINEENLNVLNQITDEIAVVAVVGPYHSGKSFLLNQLMERTDGFEIGPTTQPSTMGIWMWGSPKKFQSGGKEYYILYLDTEGFYANNVSEAYDAKIFGVSTLLSSYLLYNSVKMIDQSSIEYLELLARRTQFFGLKTELLVDKATESETVVNQLISFPPLLWVVEDFFQDLEGKTCTNWLQNMLHGYKRDTPEGAKETSALPSIFPSIECHTLFLPASDKEDLRHLDRVKHDNLNEEYLKDLKDLKTKMFTSISGKRRGPGFLTGPSITTLLKMLVKYANNQFPAVPSVWSGFLTLQRQQAMQDALNQYKEDMSLFRREIVLSEDEFAELHSKAASKAMELYKYLLFEMKEVYEPGVTKLISDIDELYAFFRDENAKRIEAECKAVYQEKSALYDHRMNEEARLPASSKTLEQKHKELSYDVKYSFSQRLDKFKKSSHFAYYSNALEKALEGSYAQIALRNIELTEKTLIEALEKATEEYVRGMNETLQMADPLSNNMLIKWSALQEMKAFQVFEDFSKFASQEKSYFMYKEQAMNTIKGYFSSFKRQNDERIDKIVQGSVESLVANFQELSKSIYQMLPLDDKELDSHIETKSRAVLNMFKEKLANYSDSPSFQENYSLLESQIKEQTDLIRKNNIDQLIVACQGALNRARKIIKSGASQFYLTWTFASWAYSVAEEEIGDAIKSARTRKEVIRGFLETDLEEEFSQVSAQTKKIALLVLFVVMSGMYAYWQYTSRKLAETHTSHRTRPTLKK